MANSRNKGAKFEREVAQELHAMLGVNFKRDLDQYREKDRGDLIADCEFPFLIECKRYAGGGFLQTWWDQAAKAAAETGQHAAVIYRFDRQPVRARVQLAAVTDCLCHDKRDGIEEHLIDIPFEGFVYLCREGMA